MPAAAALLAEQFQTGDGRWCAPERAAIQVDRLKPGPLRRQADGAGDAAPLVFGPPTMCSGPGDVDRAVPPPLLLLS